MSSEIMLIEISQIHGDEIETLIPLLLLAEPSESALRWSLGHLSDTAYRAEYAGQVIGVVTVRWGTEPCEILELAIAEGHQGKGFGKQIIEWLIAEARRRGKERLLVGTGNASIGNIVFYQRCGFRMDHVRRDYFWYYDEPIFEHGIQVRDMLTFSYDLTSD